jgi:unsaturated chondroitin disaccharide hydrolase
MSKYEKLNGKNLEDNLKEIWDDLDKKVTRMMTQIGEKSPHVAVAEKYDDMRLDWWTSGFWPGILWIMYDMTSKEEYKEKAWAWDEKIEACYIRENNLHHDVGFQFLPTAVIKYKLTGDKDGRRRGLAAANFLAGRFNIAGNFLRAWNQEKIGWSIIDSSMNLSVLFWAAEEISDPRFKHIAKAHADTVIKDFIREDGSVNHIVSFNPETGEFIESLGGQGFGPKSSWSRGQAWAIYGMANTYKYTGDIKYLRAAQRVANYFISCLPEDFVAHWDFRVPSLNGEPRDTSAAACAASGMLEIAKHLSEEEGRLYRETAKDIIASLTKNYATWDNFDHEAILLEATGNKPANSNINVSLIYGDYYYVECIAKLCGWNKNIF